MQNGGSAEGIANEEMCVICMNPVHYEVDADGNVIQEDKVEGSASIVTGRRGGIFTFFSFGRPNV